ncbi:hypothetical protein MmiHf6_10300 [Methanimicrococcus hongohii]|uniref:Uncharacterized protein n=1 Tax=Methanimicrococcus hongohii TaxID=3028295 RepID=A0AA96V981_9EURY|nr:hypothetical protein [Methanimicrococcus sp. Hf6]WNY23716.1 hypothetical protein MmiHf6_10300 [Methanimicrococcus sp. Hf6]
MAYQYLLNNKDKLDQRKSDSSVSWFEYGRTQALEYMNSEKLLLSTLVTNEVQVYHLSQECIPYSGIYIESISDYSLNDAEKILKTSDFEDYVSKIGINASGNSKRITSKDIANYYFEEIV